MAEEDYITWPDYLVIAGYFIIIIGVGVVSSCGNRGTVAGYFLAARNMNWILVGASLFASNIGSGHFIGLAGSGAFSGIGTAVFEVSALYILIMLGWLFTPVYMASGVFTMPEYMKKRFGGERIQIYLSCMSLVLYVFTKISADLFSGALFIQESMGLGIYPASIILLTMAGLFTIAGGLTAVIWTDFAQTIIMIIGSIVLTIVGFINAGGYERMVTEFLYATPDNSHLANITDQAYYHRVLECGKPTPYSMHLIRPVSDPEFPWTGVLFGLTINSVWYWCTDQVIVQRAISSKSLTHAKAGTVLASYLKLLPMFIMVMPGMIARLLWTDDVACSDPDVCEATCGNRNGCTNSAFIYMVLRLLPTGAKGLMLAVMMSALMSSLTSIFNSASTIFTMDLWSKMRKNTNDTERMIVGRLFILVLVGVSIAWLPIVAEQSQLFHYIQQFTTYFGPPICAVFLLGVFWGRTNELGAFSGLMAGLVTGMVRFIWEFTLTEVPCAQRTPENAGPAVLTAVHYLHFSIINFAVSFLVAIVVSLMTKPIHPKHLHRLTFWTRHSMRDRIDLDQFELEQKTAKKLAKRGEKWQTDEEAKKGKENVAYIDETATSSGATNDVHEKIEKEQNNESRPFWKTAFLWICGIENAEALAGEGDTEVDTDISETKLMKHILNVNAIIVAGIGIFVWVFYR